MDQKPGLLASIRYYRLSAWLKHRDGLGILHRFAIRISSVLSPELPAAEIDFEETLQYLFCKSHKKKKGTLSFLSFGLSDTQVCFVFVFSESEKMDETMKNFQESLTELESEAEHLLLARHQVDLSNSQISVLTVPFLVA